MWTLIQSLLPSIVTGVITGLIAVWLVPRHYYRQQWWQLKVQAYTEIIRQLSALEYCLGEWGIADINAVTFTATKCEALQRRFEGAEEAVKTAAAAGELLISARAAHFLGRFLTEMLQYDPEEELTSRSMADSEKMERLYVATQHTIRDLRAEALHDLRIRTRWPWSTLPDDKDFPTDEVSPTEVLGSAHDRAVTIRDEAQET